jgi:hypothetical protein
MIETTWASIAALRLERQHLVTRAPRDRWLEVVRALVAIQAQVMGSAELALNARVDGLTRDDVRDALWTHRTLVKTWAMRGTLHLVAADQLPELVGALGMRINWLRPIWLRYFDVTREQMTTLQDAIGETLTDRPMTRAALGAALARRLDDDAIAGMVSSGWGTFLKPAAGRGHLCFGPDEGRNVTFVDPRAWLRHPMPEPSEAAVAALLARHLAAFPGSSRGELARWWGVQGGSPLRRPLAILGDRLVELDADGTRVLALREDAVLLAADDPSDAVRLLPQFDPYTLSLQKEAEPLLPMARRALVSRTAGWISAVMVVGGAVTGTWIHEVRRGRMRIVVRPWRRLSRGEDRALREEAERIGAFLDAPVAVELVAPA